MNVLFVCTGNIFRSMSAEYLMKKYLADHKISGISVSSAGTVAHPESPFAQTVACLRDYGCDPSHHTQRKLTAKILQEQDIVICMSEKHRTVVHGLGFNAVLFNEIVYGKTEDVMDDTEYGEKYGYNYDLEKFIIFTVDYLHDAMPALIKALKLS